MTGRGRGRKIKEDEPKLFLSKPIQDDGDVGQDVMVGRGRRTEEPNLFMSRPKKDEGDVNKEVKVGRGRGKRINNEESKLFVVGSKRNDSDEEESVRVDKDRKTKEEGPKLCSSSFSESNKTKESEEKRESYMKVKERKQLNNDHMDAMLKKELDEEEVFRAKMHNHNKLRKKKGSGFANISVL